MSNSHRIYLHHFPICLPKPVYRISLPYYLVKDSIILPRLTPFRFASFNKTFWTPLEYWTAFFGRSTTLSGRFSRAASFLRTYFRITFPLARLTRRDTGSFRAYSTRKGDKIGRAHV